MSDRNQHQPPISPVRWGKDHWSTFAYLETRVVDYQGWLHNPHMRCDPKLHIRMAHSNPFSGVHNGGEYPTRLKGGVELPDHDDWSCVEDFMTYGLVEVVDERWPEKDFRGIREIQVALTEDGRIVGNAFRAHKDTGGAKFSNFEPPVWGTWWQETLESVERAEV